MLFDFFKKKDTKSASPSPYPLEKWANTYFQWESIPSASIMYEKPKDDCMLEINRMCNEFSTEEDLVLCLETWNITQKLLHNCFFVIGSPNQKTIDRRNKHLDEIWLVAKKYHKEDVYRQKRSHYFARHIIDVILHSMYETIKINNHLSPEEEEARAKDHIGVTMILYLSGAFESLTTPDPNILELLYYIPARAYAMKEYGYPQEKLLDYFLNETNIETLLTYLNEDNE